MTQPLHSLLTEVGLPLPPSLSKPSIASLCTDSRQAGPGSLFVGLPGTQVDGGCFWRQVLAAGAAAAVIGPAAAAADPPAADDAVVVVSEPVARWAGELAASL